MATKTETYVDTSALIAFLDRSDSYHPHYFANYSPARPRWSLRRWLSPRDTAGFCGDMSGIAPSSFSTSLTIFQFSPFSVSIMRN